MSCMCNQPKRMQLVRLAKQVMQVVMAGCSASVVNNLVMKCDFETGNNIRQKLQNLINVGESITNHNSNCIYN